MTKKKCEPIDIDYSKLIKYPLETPIPVLLAVPVEVLAERLAKAWVINEKWKEEKRLRGEEC
ncbi:hypothetical protein [Clostridium perfringens]|uniref:Uncharacterized protein n=1 Tax=Clostridium perfringens TaxID=1502 RepID=A0AAP4EEG8_CLOPF|nr:hypothetical protein [Clostridium perfringens]MDH2337037.1 hypothetical protein [Clostridium perfringens]